MSTSGTPHIRVENLEMRYGDLMIQHSLSFCINQSDIFIIMGESGCGKSTLLKHLTGLHKPASGTVYYNDVDFWGTDEETRTDIMKKNGILYQQGALWSSMTLAENIAVPLQEHTAVDARTIRELASIKLALVGLAGFEDFHPSEISGGMRKRAALARAIALDPTLLFFDEPSAGLDPVSAKRLDDLILELNQTLGTTIVVVTHELDSIFAIGSNSVFLDTETKTMIAEGRPSALRDRSSNSRVRDFLTRGNTRFHLTDSG